MNKILSILVLLIGLTTNLSGQNNGAVYIGIGPANHGNPKESDATPWSVGIVAHSGRFYWGVDLAGEGTSINNYTDHKDAVEQGVSVNFLFGRKFTLGLYEKIEEAERAPWRAGIGILAGIRRVSLSCPDSYIGYQCYADMDPHLEYKFNYGIMGRVSFNKLMLGVRVSGVSAQGLLGFAF